MQIVSKKKIYFQKPKKIKTRQDQLIHNWFEAIKSDIRNENLTQREASTYALGTGSDSQGRWYLDNAEALIASTAQKKAFLCSKDPKNDVISLFLMSKNYMPVFESDYSKNCFISRQKKDKLDLMIDSIIVGHIVSDQFNEQVKENRKIFFDNSSRKRIGVQVRSFIEEEAELSKLMKQIQICTDSKNIESSDFLFFCNPEDRILVAMLAKRFLVGDVVKTYSNAFFPPLEQKKIFSNLDAMVLFSEHVYGDVELEAACCCCPIIALYKGASDWVRKSIEGIVFFENDRYGLHRAMLNLPRISPSDLLDGASKKKLYYNTFNVLTWQQFSSKMRSLPKSKD